MKKKEERRFPEMTAPRVLELPPGILSLKPKEMAACVKLAAEISKSRKGTARQSAVSWFNFMLNRNGKNMTEKRRTAVERAKREVQRLFDA